MNATEKTSPSTPETTCFFCGGNLTKPAELATGACTSCSTSTYDPKELEDEKILNEDGERAYL